MPVKADDHKHFITPAGNITQTQNTRSRNIALDGYCSFLIRVIWMLLR